MPWCVLAVAGRDRALNGRSACAITLTMLCKRQRQKLTVGASRLRTDRRPVASIESCHLCLDPLRGGHPALLRLGRLLRCLARRWRTLLRSDRVVNDLRPLVEITDLRQRFLTGLRKRRSGARRIFQRALGAVTRYRRPAVSQHETVSVRAPVDMESSGRGGGSSSTVVSAVISSVPSGAFPLASAHSMRSAKTEIQRLWLEPDFGPPCPTGRLTKKPSCRIGSTSLMLRLRCKKTGRAVGRTSMRFGCVAGSGHECVRAATYFDSPSAPRAQPHSDSRKQAQGVNKGVHASFASSFSTDIQQLLDHCGAGHDDTAAQDAEPVGRAPKLTD